MKFSLKPVFVGWITLLYLLPFQLFFTVWAALFFGGMGKSFGIFPQDSSTPGAVIGALAFFGIPLVVYVGKKFNYARTEYNFFDDHLEFEEGFFTINKKLIKYKDVKEVTLRKGFLQQIYGLGTIYLATLATGSTGSYSPFYALGFGNVSASGIGVRDVPYPDEAYEKIKALVEKQSA
ncbi:MAG TPA: PH domain-containing protein [Xanthobacteraceae bacterium]|nr:PH domain-containing protein [Xanthobacteraceae bacterium]